MLRRSLYRSALDACARALFASGVLFSAGAAAAQDYPFTLAKTHPRAMAAWRAILPAAYQKVAWVARFEVTAGLMERIRLDGRTFIVGSVCKPHDCGFNQVAFLIAADGSSASGLARTQALRPPNFAFGVMDAQRLDALTRRLID